jgi:hypothetical protein
MSHRNISNSYNSSRGSLSRTILLGAVLSARRKRKDEPGLVYVLAFWALVALWCWWKWG